MHIRILFIWLCCNVVHVFAQKEYHFYSDQPEVYRARKVENEFTFNTSQVKNKFYINLKVALKKRTLNSNKVVTFSATLPEDKKQMFSDSYYNFDGRYYSFKIPIDVTNIDTADIKVNNLSEDLIGSTNFVVKFISNAKSDNVVYLYDANLEPVISNTLPKGQIVVPTSSQKKVFLKVYNYDAQRTNHTLSVAKMSNNYNVRTIALGSEVPYNLQEKGYYEFASDSTFANARSIIVVDNSFPKMTKASDLIKPLIYLADSSAYNEIMAHPTPKIALDEFWMSFVGNKELAKKVIKSFYNRVYRANEMYNSKTIGWKSDMGMAHIIFGTPKSVENMGNSVVWTYSEGFEIRFVKNKGGEYEFSDDSNLRTQFASAVDNIKKGNID